MDVQFYGANCVVFSNKDLRIVVDDNLTTLGAKSVTKSGDVALFTGRSTELSVQPKMVIDMPGEYETVDVSITGIPARSHLSEEESDLSATIYKIVVGDLIYVVLGHVYPELSDDQLEAMGMVDVLFIPVGGNGYTLDPVGALKLMRLIGPKLVIPTHYEDKDLSYEVSQGSLDQAVAEFAMEPKEKIEKLRVKPIDLSDVTQLVLLEKS